MNKIILSDHKERYFVAFEPKRINVFIGRTESGKYNLIDDLTRIYHQRNDIIILKNPENDQFPPDIRTLAYDIGRDKKHRYFITTNSPYLLSTIWENNNYDDINIIIVYKEFYQIEIKILTEQELQHAAELDCDLFFNLHHFTN